MAKGKKESAETWLTRIDSSRKMLSKWHKEYRTWVQYYRGEQWDISEAQGSLNPIVVNYAFNTIKTMVPTLYFKNPKFFIIPTRPEFQQRAELLQNLVNYDWRILKCKREMQRCILRSLIGGLSWMETGYTFEQDAADNVLSTEEELEQQAEAERKEIDQIVKGGGQSGLIPEEKYANPRIKKDSPFAISRSILDVCTDNFVNVFEEMSWFGVREIIPLKMAKKDGRFDHTRQLEANVKYDDIVVNTFREDYQKSQDLDFVELWHITDRWEGRTFTVARGYKGKLRDFDTPLGYGIVPLYFNEDPEQPRPISTIEVLKDIQDEKNRFRAYMLEHIKRTLPRIGYDENILTDEETINKITSSESYELIGVKGRPLDVLQPIQFPSLSPEIFTIDDKLSLDINIASGLTDFQRGQAIKVPSATEAQIIEQSSRLRVDEGLSTVAEVAEQVARNLIKLRQQFTTGETVIPIVGEEMAANWQTYTRQDIQGEYDVMVEYGSTQKRDQDFQKSQWLQLAPIVTGLAAQPSPANMELGRQILKTFEIPLPTINKIFPEQPPGADIAQLLSGLGGGQPGGQQRQPAQGGGSPPIDIAQLLGGLG